MGRRMAYAAPGMGTVKTARAKAENKRLGEQFKRRKMLMEVRAEAAEFCEGLARNIDPAEGVQQVLDNLMDRYEYATQQVYLLDEDEYWLNSLGGKVVHHWIREQERLGLQLVHVAAKASAMGLAERTVRVHEAQAALFAQVVEKALVASGMAAEDRRTLHAAIAEGMMTIEGTATEIKQAA